MTKIPLIKFGGININATTKYLSFGSGGNSYNSTTEADVKTRFRLAGTVTNLQVNVPSNSADATSTVKLRKNGANGNNIVSISAAATGLFEDTTSSDSIAAGDDLDLQINAGGSGNLNIRMLRGLFDATSNTVNKYIQDGIDFVAAASTTYFCSLVGYGGSTASEVNFKQKFATGGTLKKMGINVVTNGNANALTIRSRINGANGNLVISVTAAGTGFFEDTSNTDTVAANDYVNYSITTGAGAVSFLAYTLWVDFETTNSQTMLLFNGYVTGNSVGAGATGYPALSGSGQNATETFQKIRLGIGGTLSKLMFYTDSNSATSAVPISVRQNGSTSGITLSVTALTTGEFTDGTHTLTIGATDDLNFIVDGSGVAVGTLNTNIFTLLFAPTANTNYTSTLTESLTLTDTLIKSPVRTLTESLTLTDVLAKGKVYLSTLTESLTLTDSLLKLPARILTETLTLTSSLLKMPVRVLSETLTLTDSIVRSISRTLTETISIVDTIIKYVNGRLVFPWSDQSKHSANFTDQSKHSASFTDQSKHSSNWTDTNKS